MREKFVAIVEEFLKSTGMSPTQLGRDAVNDGSLVQGLRNGRDVRLGTAGKVLAFIREHNKRKREAA